MKDLSIAYTELRNLVEDWRSGWIKGDVESILSLYSANPALFPQSQPAVVGKNQIRPLYTSVLEQFEFESTIEIKRMEVSGDLGYVWVAYTFTARPKTGEETLTETGKSIYIAKRQVDNRWRIEIMIDNNDQPSGMD